MTVKSTDKPVRTAVFAGTFNPFTVGHASIVERGLQIFDKIIIAMGVNADKPYACTRENLTAIQQLYAHEPRIEVIEWAGLMVDLARQKKAGFFLRGIRSTVDFEYERNMADINRHIAGIETVLLPALPQYGAVSSSIVRELRHYGCPVDDFLP